MIWPKCAGCGTGQKDLHLILLLCFKLALWTRDGFDLEFQDSSQVSTNEHKYTLSNSFKTRKF